MKNYEAMSDEELNFEVARHSFDAGWLDRHYGKEGMVPDYCNDWEVAGPIIAENKISIEPHLLSDLWLSTSRGVEHAAQHENPLRASMIVFCMIHGDDQ